MMPHAVMPEAVCPACCAKLPSAGSLAVPVTHPSPGDYTVCIECASILTYGERYQLKRVNEFEIAAMDAVTQRRLLNTRRAIQTVTARYRVSH
jgi:hypothetical protein